ncbi:type II toxin-antitoxin system RelE/ParE family toxin [Paraglaciecola aquimarina]|uniref:Toxin n=1 Tax=Paraglaciecola algarum TaxID=3050085 RepID=A0ABS9D3T6_9ALTE|nr:type II toxin-antitoxin system RelE/ParE family toxin [Paraglaciecola sp. G1-23]MCF2947583.1 type II toxin-antitoxin system RelE/ParE family toxin [Paraglaciecola sp. G1-23]
MANFRLTPEAQDDLNNIVLYTVEQWGKSQAKNYVTGLNILLNRLVQTPTIGKQRNAFYDGLLSFPYASHIIYYVINAGNITVIRVLHKNMDNTKHF